MTAQKQYRVVVNNGQSKEFANLAPAMRYQDKHGGILEFRQIGGEWYSSKP